MHVFGGEFGRTRGRGDGLRFFVGARVPGRVGMGAVALGDRS